jgi:FtsP/CotA-like multicopper oxidase with cupredoxin domain
MEKAMLSRRNFLGTATALASATAISGRAQAANIPEASIMDNATMQPPLHPTAGPDYNPVVTLNGWTLPWRMNGDWKEFHLVAEPIERELAEGMKAYLWGYNGQAPGPTIEAVEGDKVRIFVTNKLPEHTTVHWHGVILPNGMDGVGGLSQPHIKPGKTFVYEFQFTKSGTFMYHPHSDEMVQMAMGMMGMIVVHPRDVSFRPVDRDFVFIMSTYDIDPGTYLPKVNEMTNFNMWTWNSRVFPGIDPLPVRPGRPGARAHRQPHHDQSSDPSARPQIRGQLHRRRMGPRKRTMARDDDRRTGRSNQNNRLSRR